MTTFSNTFLAELAIRKLIQNDNHAHAFLNYNKINDTDYKLHLVTLNPVHDTHFLMHSIQGDDLLMLYNDMYKYVYELKAALKQHDSPYLSYTVEWYNDNKIELSYFSGTSVEDVVRKFNYGKSSTPTIFSIKLNPQT
jgi:hypothetical protein